MCHCLLNKSRITALKISITSVNVVDDVTKCSNSNFHNVLMLFLLSVEWRQFYHVLSEMIKYFVDGNLTYSNLKEKYYVEIKTQLYIEIPT